MLKVTGICHSAGKPDDYQGVYLTESETSDKGKKLSGTKVLLEHDTDAPPIATVISGGVDSQGRLTADIELPLSSFNAWKTVEKIRNGELTGLSLGIEYDVDASDLSIVNKEIKEVSFVKDPAIPETLITHIPPRHPDTENNLHKILKYKSDYEQRNALKRQKIDGAIDATVIETDMNNKNKSIDIYGTGSTAYKIGSRTSPVILNYSKNSKPIIVASSHSSLSPEKTTKMSTPGIAEQLQQQQTSSQQPSVPQQSQIDFEGLKRKAIELEEREKKIRELENFGGMTLEQYQEHFAKKRKKELDKNAAIKEEMFKYVAECLANAGRPTENDRVLEAIKESDINPVHTPLMKLVSVAHNDKKISIQRVEEKYQEEQKKLKMDLENANKQVETYANQLKQRQTYASTFNQPSYQQPLPQAPSQHQSQQQQQQPSGSVPPIIQEVTTTTRNYSFPENPLGARPVRIGVGPLWDEKYKEILPIIKSIDKKQGMSVMDIPGLTGYEYPTGTGVIETPNQRIMSDGRKRIV
jgi:hypothetical protein